MAGGLIIALLGEEEGWRWIFLVNVPIGVMLLVAIAALVPAREVADAPDARLDPVGALLLGAAVLCLLLPVVSLEGGQRLPLFLLVLAPALSVAFVRWERRVVARGGAPLLELGLLRAVPGYASGIAIGTLYFTGFTGVILVLSVFLQDGLDYSALQTGLLLTPFAVGSAVASPVAGRLVSRVGRRLTVVALATMIGGLLSLAALVPLVDGTGSLWWILALTLLVSGLGGGAVVSPNFTLTLAEVPTRMGGAAGGGVQTGQRIGAAIGAALVMTAYQVAVTRFEDAAIALRWALVVSVVVLVSDLAVAVWSWRREPEHAEGTM